jgi:hypothetical protein
MDRPNNSSTPLPSSPKRGNLLAGLALLVLLAAGVGWLFLQNQPPLVATRPLAQKGVLPAAMGDSWKKMDNPGDDGWDTEVTSSAADKVLKQLGTYLKDPEHLDAAKLDKYVAPEFTCGPLMPEARVTVFRDGVFHIERGRVEKKVALNFSERYQGSKGLVQALHELTAPLKGAKDIHTKFKLFRIQPTSADTFTTVQFFAYSGHLPQGMIEQNATWEMLWKLESSSSDPTNKSARLLGIQVSDFELCHSTQPKGLFADCTRSVLEKNDCYQKQFLHGLNTWFERIQDTRNFYLLGNPGLAVGDVNGDGLDDLYVCQEEGLPNRLFLHQPDGSVRDVSEAWGVNWLHSSRGALIVDLDNDGKQDLAVAMVGYVVLAQNLGDRFEIRHLLPTDGDTMSLSAADYNGDGKLDLHACVYFSKTPFERRFGEGGAGLEGERPGTRGELVSSNALANDGQGGGRDALFRNDIKEGKWAFADVTKDAGLDADNRRFSFAACWEDFDNDSKPDLYIANDYGRNQLYRNEGNGRFKDIARELGAEDTAFSMSASWADYNQDGWMDLYIGNMFSGAGNRITFQPQFLKDKGGDRKTKYQRYARGNTLLKNLKGSFSDVSEDAGIAMGRWTWSSNFVDINNDGLEDLLVANGYITTEDTGDL